ncbi:MAG: hypothetical protein ACRDJP_11210 [Actinomycetota bacterium]
MRIRATCRNCGREVLPQQVVDAGGHCPWCGIAFTRDYTSIIVRSLREAEVAGEALQDALEQVAEVEELGLELDEESILQPLRDALRTIRRRGARV